MERFRIDPTLIYLSIAASLFLLAAHKVGKKYKQRTRSGYNAPGLWLGQQLLLFVGVVCFGVLLFTFFTDIL